MQRECEARGTGVVGLQRGGGDAPPADGTDLYTSADHEHAIGTWCERILTHKGTDFLANCSLDSLNGFLNENRVPLYRCCCPETEHQNWVAENLTGTQLMKPRPREREDVVSSTCVQKTPLARRLPRLLPHLATTGTTRWTEQVL